MVRGQEPVEPARHGATDALTGANRYTFRSGRQTYQDVLTAKNILGASKGKKVVVLAQDNAFGQANAAAVKSLQSERLRQLVASLGAEPAWSSPGELAQRLASDLERLGAVVRKIGLKKE